MKYYINLENHTSKEVGNLNDVCAKIAKDINTGIQNVADILNPLVADVATHWVGQKPKQTSTTIAKAIELDITVEKVSPDEVSVEFYTMEPLSCNY